MAKRNQSTARSGSSSAQGAEISVDLAEADPSKAVSRRERPVSDIASQVRDNDTDDAGEETPAERRFLDRSKAVNKRIGRMQRTFDQRMAEQQAENQRQLTGLRKEVDRLKLDRGGNTDASQAETAHTAKMNELQGKLEAAIEKGDSREQARITVEINRAETAYWAAKATAAGVAQRTEGERGTEERRAEGAAPPPRTTGPTAAGSRFILKNEDWWSDPEYEVEKDAAGKIYGRLTKEEGYDANSDETFAEVSRQLKAKFPNLDIHYVGEDEDEDDDLEDPPEDRRRREPVRREARRAAVPRLEDRGGDADARRQTGRRTLTAEEMGTMRAVGLDPLKDRDVVQFLRDAQALDELEGSRARA